MILEKIQLSKMGKSCLIVFLLIFFSISFYPTQAESPSLKHQLEQGINHKDLVCKESLELIFKSTDFSPACVKSSTAEVLLDRDWNIFDKNLIEVSTDRAQYQIDDEVQITIKNAGTQSAFFGSSAFGIFILNSSDETMNTCSVFTPAVMKLSPNEQKTFHWTTEIDCSEEIIPKGEFSIFVMYNVHPRLELPFIETEKQMIMIS